MEQGARLHYIDWLRVLAVLLLFPFHTSRVFNAGEPFYIKSEFLSHALDFTLWFISLWHMQLLFVLAGASAYFSLRKRTGGVFVRERVTRLLVPLAFGILVLIPPQTWVGAQYNSGYTGSYLSYLTSGDFLRWNIQEAGDYYGGFGIGQLWFILFLFVISLLALPLFSWWRKSGAPAAWLAERIARPLWWWIPALALLLAEAFPAVAGKNLAYYLVFFVLGYLTMASERFVVGAQRHAGLCLAGGWVACAAFIAGTPLRETTPDPSLVRVGFVLLASVGAWATIIGMLGLGRRFLNAASPALNYLAEGSYPIYILHQTAIVLAGFFLVTGVVPGPWPLQWIAVLTVAVAASFGGYEVVRRTGALRFLFGMRPVERRAGR